MKKFGFTLAEVLITLGIIGVVAALTAPALVKNSGQAKIGPTLAKFVNTFETACEQMMHDEEINSLNSEQSVTDGSGFFDNLSKYMIMTKLDQNTVNNYKVFVGENAPNYTIAKYLYQLKDGSVLGVAEYTPSYFESYTPTGAYKGKGIGPDGGFIFIDINGIKGNNKIAKEVFGFVLDNSGILIPIGSNAYKSLITSSDAHKICNANSSDEFTALACTGKIADNGWKADY